MDWIGVPVFIGVGLLFFFADRIGSNWLRHTVDGTIMEPSAKWRKFYIGWNRIVGRIFGIFFFLLALYTLVFLVTRS